MNYGSSNFKNFDIKLDWIVNPLTFDGIIPGFGAAPSVDVVFYLINKWVRTLSMSNTEPLTEVPIEFNYVGQMSSAVEHFFNDVSASPNVDDELMLVGGNFWNSVLSGVKKYLPVVRGVVNAVGSAVGAGVGGRRVGRPSYR